MEVVNRTLAKNHISVDCVVLGFNEDKLKVLLVNRKRGEICDDKLPGNLIFVDEDLDEAAHRTLFELTGVNNSSLTQFKSYGSSHRTDDYEDVEWLEQYYNTKIERIVTVAYFSTVQSIEKIKPGFNAKWVGVDEVEKLAFDHNRILSDAISYFQSYVYKNPNVIFDLLPRKFTVSQLRVLYELIYERKLDVRNFQKKMMLLPYIKPLDEFQKNVAHRAARYYKFDRVVYKKLYNKTKSFIK